MRILLSRTDSLGDVILTLPMVGMIKKHYPNAKVDFLGASYSKPILECVPLIDAILLWDQISELSEEDQIATFQEGNYDICIHVFPKKEIARIIKKSKIPQRIGTSGRLFHLTTCNNLVRFSRKRSDLHESQLNMKLLKPLGINELPDLTVLASLADFRQITPLPSEFSELIDPDRYSVILHPKSKGSAAEWGLENFNSLIQMLDPKKYQVFVSGTEHDLNQIGDHLDFNAPHVVNIAGKFNLSTFISFINATDALVAASTGPLHISGILNKVTIGLYSSRRPIHPGRWQPLGAHSFALVFDEKCVKCKSGNSCECITQIMPEAVLEILDQTSSEGLA